MLIHIGVHSETVVTRLCDWADEEGFDYYVAPKAESSERNPAEHVTINEITNEKAGELIGYITANGWKTEIMVE
ncbi:MAG TPA: hypothetical protein VK667_02610 [Ktedonobacteraceae bacterium]|nr:hypothetical protein [Ktedonobacteraceae bacterium]